MDDKRTVRPTIEEIVEQTSMIYTLPLFYERLNEVINHPRSSLADVGHVISEDQGLTVRLLKLANSPLFGYHAKIDSITKALTLIGTQQLRDLALAVSVIGSFGSVSNKLFDMKSFWRHNIVCGILSRAIATCRREVNQERFFVAGMLHDVGLLVMCSAAPDLINQALTEKRESGGLYYQIERQKFGFGHGDVGSALLTKWKIPANISQPIEFHHQPTAAGAYSMEASTIHLADIICHTMGLGHAEDWLVPPLDETAWKMLDIPVKQLDNIIKQSEGQIESTFAVMSEDV